MSDKKEAATKVKKGFNIASLRTDKTKDVEGVWCDHEDGLRLLIARANNPNAKAYRNKLMKKHKRAVQKIDMNVLEDINHQITAKHVLLGWENLQDIIKGKVVDIKYSEEAALAYLRDIDGFSEIVAEYAGDFEAYALEDQEEDAKNS